MLNTEVGEQFSINENNSELYSMACQWADAIIAILELSNEKSIRAQQSGVDEQPSGLYQLKKSIIPYTRYWEC